LSSALRKANSPPTPKPPSPPPSQPRTTFSSLRSRNFRLLTAGNLVSFTGAWVQRIAQDWLILTLTGSATAVGITTALQFLPTLLFGLTGGLIADRYPKRRILLATQAGMAAMAATLAGLALTHHVVAWHIYAIAFGLGLVTAVDNPARQSFVNEVVGPDHLHNAVSINASVFQFAALIGPAISGVLMSAVGAGYAFAVNAVSYIAPVIGLLLIRDNELLKPVPTAGKLQLRDGIRYVASRRRMLWPTVLVGVFGMFTINLPVTLAAYAKSTFHSGAGGYALLSSVAALGSLAGALISARRSRITLRGLAGTCLVLAALEILAAAAPGELTYCLLLAPVGAATLLVVTSTNSMIQLGADESIRGRVMGVYLLVFVGSGALGGPLVGSIDEHFGPSMGMLLAGAVPAVATILVALKLARDARLRVQLRLRRPLSRLLVVVPR
jgi:MFS family permease